MRIHCNTTLVAWIRRDVTTFSSVTKARPAKRSRHGKLWNDT